MTYDTYYGAKFARERTGRPTEWIIAPVRNGYALRYTGAREAV